MNQDIQHPNRPLLANLFLGLAFLCAIIGIYMAFLPTGFGFLAAVPAFIGVNLAGMATRNGAGEIARWGVRANFLPILVYATYMGLHIPATESTQTVQVRVVETGVLANQMVFDKKTRASGNIQGVRMLAQPCGQEFVVQVTGKPNSHLGVYVPSDETRECLAQITNGADLEMDIITAQSIVLNQIKDFRVARLGSCVFEGADNGAVVKGLACAEWRTDGS